MTSVDPFLIPIPKAFQDDPEVQAWAQYLGRVIHDLWVRTGSGTDTISETSDTVVSHSEKLDFVTVTQNVDLDTMESDLASTKADVDLIATASPTYAISNDGTDRSLNADAAAGSISSPPTQAEVENIRDAQLGHADNLATLIRDLAAKGVLDT